MAKALSLFIFMSNVTCVDALIKPSLRNIITNNAIITTLFKEVNKELLDETTIITDFNYIDNPNITDKTINNSLVGISFYSILFILGLIYENNNAPNIDKLQKIEMYKTYTKKTRILLLILILVFNRHIENAI
jgi:hypothetical protein